MTEEGSQNAPLGGEEVVLSSSSREPTPHSKPDEPPTESERWANNSGGAKAPQQQQQVQGPPAGSNNYNNETQQGQQQEEEEDVSIVASGDTTAIVQQALAPSDAVRLWKASPWAVGFTKPAWRDEPLCETGNDICSPLCFSACFCRCAGRVGNMVVFARTSDKLLWITGPYWMILVFVTIPFLSTFSIWVAYKKVSEQSLGVVIPWAICTGSMFTALLLTGCRDPGILRRVRQIDESSTWRWNDQSLTYRPSHAKYDSECACVIAEFDHTCPWTGTAIGKKNMFTFRLFLISLFVCLAFNVCLLILL